MNARTFPVSAAELAETEASTSTTFDQDEASVQSSQPVEYYDIGLSTGVTYRVAAGERDLQVGSIVYTATPAARSEIAIAQTDGSGTKQLTVTLPVNHPVVKRWFQYGVPPRQTTVTLWRKQERSALSERVWGGLVTSVSCDGNLAKLLVPARTIDTMQRTLPTISSGQSCPWTLFDPNTCKVNRTVFSVTTTAILVNGRSVRVDLGSTARNGDWSESGELLHIATGERMTVAKQADVNPGTSSTADLTLEQMIPELATGAAITVYAGCKKSIAVCLSKFGNVPNFGGSPNAPTRNPFLYTERLL